LSNLVISFIRTYVPIIVGSVLSWVAVNSGIIVSEDLKNEATVFFTALIIALYYGILHLLEQKWPAFGKLLGKEAIPVYSLPPAA
jgi:hypothetical protein